MLPFRKIVFPVDFSNPCHAIIPYVRDSVAHFDAQLMLVHANVPLPVLPGEFAVANLIVPEDDRATQEEHLRRFAADSFPGMQVDTVVETGEPGRVIHDIVRRHGGDLVMMPTHGHGPLRRLLLGSVTAKVLHDVSPAVWTGVGSVFEGHSPAIPYKSVLCALDQSAEAVAVLRASSALARSYGAQLFLFHAVQTPPPTGEIDVSAYSKEIVEAANAWLRELKGSEGIDASHSVSDRSVGGGIREEALRRKADLIVVGRGHAQGAVSRLWSHLYTVIRESPCPVLSI